jgi:Rap1a immunity proteins
MRCFCLIAIVLHITVATASQASESEDFAQNCRYAFSASATLEQSIKGAICAGYLDAIQDELLMRYAPSGICIPDEVTVQQLVAVYLNWYDKHPKQWHES